MNLRLPLEGYDASCVTSLAKMPAFAGLRETLADAEHLREE